MADAGFFRGTNSEQDSRFFNKTKKLMKSMKFPPNINTKVDMSKVNMDVVKPWITKRVTEILGFEDDVVIEFIFNLFEGNQFPDPKELQMNITGFLNGKNARLFMQELWDLLMSAQESVGGIPAKFLEMKKEQLREERAEQDRIQASLKRHEELERERERELLEQRAREYEAKRLAQERERERDEKEREERTREEKEREERRRKEREAREREKEERRRVEREERDKEREQRRREDRGGEREKGRGKEEKRDLAVHQSHADSTTEHLS
jgi:serine/arginine repetitive matrix protein 1